MLNKTYNPSLYSILIVIAILFSIQSVSGYDFGNALVNAAHNCNFRELSLLIKQGADVNAKDNHGLTAIDRAVGVGCGYGMVKILLEAGAEPNNSDKNGTTPLMSAVRQGNPKVVKILMEYGANYSTMDINGLTAKDYALKNGNSDLIELFQKFTAPQYCDKTVISNELNQGLIQVVNQINKAPNIKNILVSKPMIQILDHSLTASIFCTYYRNNNPHSLSFYETWTNNNGAIMISSVGYSGDGSLVEMADKSVKSIYQGKREQHASIILAVKSALAIQ